MRSLMLLLAAVMLPACAGDPLVPLTVTVTDAATAEPVAGAKVIAETPNSNHPLTLFTDTESVHSAAFTDELGRATVEYRSGHPVRIGVLARGYPMLIENIGEPWLGPVELGGPEGRTVPSPLRIVVRPTGAEGRER